METVSKVLFKATMRIEYEVRFWLLLIPFLAYYKMVNEQMHDGSIKNVIMNHNHIFNVQYEFVTSEEYENIDGIRNSIHAAQQVAGSAVLEAFLDM